MVKATVTDTNGETHDANTTIKVANIELEAALIMPDQVDIHRLNDESLNYKVTNLNGEPQSSSGAITIYQLKAPSQIPLRNAPWDAPDSPIISKEEFKKLFPHEDVLFGQNTNWKKWERGHEIVVFEFEGSDGNFTLPALAHGAYVAALTMQDPSGDTVSTQAFFKAFDSENPQLFGNELIHVQPDKSIYKVGEQIQLAVGSASEDMTVVLDIFRKDQPVETRLVHISKEVKTIRIDVKPEDIDGLRIDYYFVNYNDHQKGSKRITVQQPVQEHLEIETVTFRDKIMPGNEESWSFTIKGNNNEAAEAEVLASMYDASLDQFLPHQWHLNPSPRRPFYYSNHYSFEGFEQRNFITTNLQYHYSSKPHFLHNQLNWFGLSLGSKRENSVYLNRLRSYRELFSDAIYQSYDSTKAKGRIYGLIKSKDKGLPIAGVNVSIKGTTRSTLTNVNGEYNIKYQTGEVLTFSFIGYKTEEVNPEVATNIINIDLAPQYENLSEVVVVGYGEIIDDYVEVLLDAEVTEETVIENIVFSEAPAEEVPDEEEISEDIRTRRIAGLAEMNDDMLYIIDGVPVAKSDIETNEIASMEVLHGAEATSLYGARAANGVVIIQTKAGNQKLNQMLAQVKARKDLRETAFFYPHLRTNKKGAISFTFNSPETLTKWKLQLLAHNQEMKTGSKTLMAVTQKELMVVPNTPRFLRHGDRIELATKIINLTQQPQQTQVAISLYDALTNEEITKSLISENTHSIMVPAIGSQTTSWVLDVPATYDALSIKVVATNGTYSDGEQRVVPVLSNRQLVTESMPIVAKGGSTKSFEMTKLTQNLSTTLKHQSVTLEMTPNPIWEVVKALPYLMEYPYECSEQTFSRLYANLLSQQIIKQNPAIKTVFEKWQSSDALISNLDKNEELKSLILRETPWLRDAANEAQQQKQIALLFDLNRSGEQATKTLEVLQSKQLSNGAFPWFINEPNRYITQYIVTGFAHLKRLGIEPTEASYQSMVNKAIQYLDQKIAEDYDRLQLDPSKDPQKHLTAIQVQYLYTRSYFDQEIADELQKAIDYYTQQSITYWADFGLMAQAMIALTHYQNGNMDQANELLRSLDENSLISEDQGMYWKANTGGSFWYQSAIETQAIILEAFQEIMSDTDERKSMLVNEMKNWLIQHKHSNSWKTTKATTEAVFAMLLNTSLTEMEESPVAVIINDESLKPTAAEAGTGHFKRQWQNEAINSGLGKVTVTNDAATMTYGSLTWQYLEEFDKITANENSSIKLSKTVYKVARDHQGEVLKNIDERTSLATGDLLRIRITLEANKDMEYVHMKDQRAAGLEPISSLSSYKWQEGLGYYQSTKDASTDFFFDQIFKGIYVFEYDLRVNNNGSFTNGLTTIQCMYAPEYNSHSESIRLNIGE